MHISPNRSFLSVLLNGIFIKNAMSEKSSSALFADFRGDLRVERTCCECRLYYTTLRNTRGMPSPEGMVTSGSPGPTSIYNEYLVSRIHKRTHECVRGRVCQFRAYVFARKTVEYLNDSNITISRILHTRRYTYDVIYNIFILSRSRYAAGAPFIFALLHYRFSFFFSSFFLSTPTSTLHSIHISEMYISTFAKR